MSELLAAKPGERPRDPAAAELIVELAASGPCLQDGSESVWIARLRDGEEVLLRGLPATLPPGERLLCG